MRKLPPLNAIRAFEAAARYVSFTKAADELCVTQGAVSRQVALLEQWFGVKLFRRGPSQLILTDLGAVYFKEVTALLDRLALASMHMMEQATPKALRINAPPTFAMRWSIGRLSTFQRSRPDVELRLTTSVSPLDANDFGFDIAIRGDTGQVSGWVAMEFMTELIAPVCHADLLTQAPLNTLDDLQRHTLITYLTEPYSWEAWFSQTEGGMVAGQGVLRFEQMYFALQAVQDCMGVALIPLFLVIDELKSGRLCVPFGPLGLRKRSYSAFFRNESEEHRMSENCCDWLRKAGLETEQSIDAWARDMGW